jgi:hypothetical protein
MESIPTYWQGCRETKVRSSEENDGAPVANSHGLLPTASALIGVSRTILDELLVGRHADTMFVLTELV